MLINDIDQKLFLLNQIKRAEEEKYRTAGEMTFLRQSLRKQEEELEKDKNKKKLTRENVKCTVNGTTAKCTVCKTPDDCDDDEIVVVKEGGAWKVSMSKEDVKKEE